MELSLGEIPNEEGANTNCSFVAVFRPSIEESLIRVGTSSSELTSDSGDTSPLSVDSKDDSFSSGGSGGNSKVKSSAGSDTLTSVSSFSLDNDVEKALQSNKDRLDQKLNGFSKSMKGIIDTEYNTLEKKFMILQQKVHILEQENERLFQQTEKHHEHIKLLEEELGVLQKTSEKFSLIQLLRNDYTYKVFLDYCKHNNTVDMVSFYKEADEFRNKYAHIEGIVSSMEEEAKNIYEKYLNDNSPKSINIPYDSKSSIKYHIGTPSHDMFDLALGDVLSILKETSFDKFCESGEGKATLQHLLM